jgi:hypothetical protein
MFWKRAMFTQKGYETCIPRLISNLQERLNNIPDIIPFDKLYDEDTLNGSYEKLEILNQRIDEIMNAQRLDTETLREFVHMKQSTEQDIESLLLDRFMKYAEWKKGVMKITEDTIQFHEYLCDLAAIDIEFQKLMNKRIKMDTFAVTKFHNMVNTLLHISSYRKENLPSLAFASAYNKGLIDSKLYKRLIKST